MIGVTQYGKEVKVSDPTARSDLKKLEQLGILENLEIDPITYGCAPVDRVAFEILALRKDRATASAMGLGCF